MHQTLIFGQDVAKIKRCEESKRTLKNPFASRFAEFNTTLKCLRIRDQSYIVLVKFRFGRNRDFLAVLLLSLAGGPKDGKPFGADWRLISSASFHTSSDSCERNTPKWNSNNKDCKKETIGTLMWLRRSSGSKLGETECFATTTIPLFALYLINYIHTWKRKNIYIYIYLCLIRPGAEIILRFSSQFSRI